MHASECGHAVDAEAGVVEIDAVPIHAAEELEHAEHRMPRGDRQGRLSVHQMGHGRTDSRSI